MNRRHFLGLLPGAIACRHVTASPQPVRVQSPPVIPASIPRHDYSYEIVLPVDWPVDCQWEKKFGLEGAKIGDTLGGLATGGRVSAY